MSFASVPHESRKSIDRAGHILVNDHANPLEYALAIELADQWRACHAYPINTFQATLREKIKNYSDGSIVAQRLKRMPTIIDKLKRFPDMQLSNMQDIGGVRAILGSIKEVYDLAAEYKIKSRFAHELLTERDYINQPRDEDGYRSLHLIYKYKNARNPNYDNLRLELQIRTKLQHTWATAVETMGTFLGQALKSRQGDQEWLDFFAITSSAFAKLEKSPAIPRFKHLSTQDTFLAVADAEAKLGALIKMRGLSTAVDFIGENRKGWSYHLIILKSLERRVQVKSYNRDGLEQATVELAKLEKEASEGRKIEPVLVSAGPVNVLRRAYPNFFLDISEFVKTVDKIISSASRGNSS